MGACSETPLLLDDAVRPRAQLVLAHGAGAPMDSPFMQRIASGLASRGIAVVRFEFPYMARRRREGTRAGPDRMPVLEASFREVVARVSSDLPLFVGGKSMGARVAVQVADALGAAGVIALGYPFHPPRRPDKLRVDVLRALRTRCLVVHGTRDPLGSPEEVAAYALPRRISLCWVPDGDHDLCPRKSSGRTHEQNLAEAVARVAAFVLKPRGQKTA